MKMEFSRLVLFRSAKDWILENALKCHDGTNTLEIPAGFKTDFASIPRGLHNLFPKNGEYDAAAILHDWLYFLLGKIRFTNGIEKAFSRKDCDEIFLSAMESLGVGWFTRKTMFRAVRMFGGIAWNGHKKRIENEKADFALAA